jgi:hypothetical protein
VYGAGRRDKLEGMERICSQCYAVIGVELEGDWCPACGGAIVSRSAFLDRKASRAVVDRRGIVLPRRHAVGGIISPQ